jgi:hypothetical protein
MKSRRTRRTRRQERECTKRELKAVTVNRRSRSIAGRYVSASSAKLLPTTRKKILAKKPSIVADSVVAAAQNREAITRALRPSPTPQRNLPMGRGELYSYYERMGMLEVYYAMFGADIWQYI